MPLLSAALGAGFTAASVAGMANLDPVNGRRDQAILYARAYDTYARMAASLGGSPPTVVNYAGFEEALIESFSRNPVGFSAPATDWAEAIELYWTGAAFGPSGIVTIVPPAAILAGALESLWRASSLVPTPAPAISVSMALLLHSYTLGVIVKDTALPPPVGSLGPIA